jgi:hypothetical protein
MTQFPSTPNLAKAVIKLIKEVGPIAKNLDVGSGKNTYKGVADKDVKEKVGQALAECGLCLLPIEVEANESTFIAKNQYGDEKSNFFTSVRTKYLLLHDSGESVVLTGYGHGVDTQDKAAGKATTYALKYLLLYLSLAPTGTIDDTDGTHSDNLPPRTVTPPATPASSAKPAAPAPAPKPAATPEQSISNFENQAKPATPQAPAPTNDPAPKLPLSVSSENWPRIKEWALMNKGKGIDHIKQKLEDKYNFDESVVNELKKELGI